MFIHARNYIVLLPVFDDTVNISDYVMSGVNTDEWEVLRDLEGI
jgi:hypothetical protein